MNKFKQAQASIELSLSFVVVLLFLLGMLRVWFWGNNELYSRQQDYINTREANDGNWPVHSSNLSDDIIFHGDF